MTESRRLLIVEDDPGLQSQMRWCFDGLDVFVAANAGEAESILRKEEPQVITLDLGLPPDPGGPTEGFKILQLVTKLLPNSKVIVVTGIEEREHALRAVAEGAYDFYQKPIDAETLRFVVDRAFRLAELEQENRRLASLGIATPLDGLISASSAMLDVCRQTERVAPTDATVLINGATGTGKEIIAQAIHRLSDRRDGPMAVINCAAIPETLLESELFGHEKGSFTGAIARKIGKIEHASGGTLFLDEIGDMPLALQAKILRFLQERTVERVGSNTGIDVDVRVISATHRPLEDLITSGEFREDLFFRISEIALNLPPLAERDGDAVLIAKVLMARHATKPLKLSPDAMQALESWEWPGNVRELENRVKRACILSDGPLVTALDLELEAPEHGGEPLNLREVRALAEKQAINRALERTDKNISKAARLLGISRPTLYNLFARYEITVDEPNE